MRQAESGTPVAEITRKMGISEVTFYRWKKKFAGMGVSELRRLKQLEDENRRLKRLVGYETYMCQIPYLMGGNHENIFSVTCPP